jgi:Mrp family chromosome partitioning ATPase
VILVVRAGKTLREEVKRSTRMVRDVGGTVSGIILNEFEAKDRDGYYYNYYGYGDTSKAEDASAG